MTHFKELRNHIKFLELEFKSLDEARAVTELISILYPSYDRVYFGILELLINAVEHGNLEIGFSEKSKLLESGTWADEIKKRLALNEYACRKVKVQFSRDEKEITLKIEDCGKGFNWKEYLSKEDLSSSKTEKHGRGIIMSKIMCFDEMLYEGSGNIAIAKVSI